ncbi:MAG: hypothetical protein ACJAZN_002917 [Planctomycetota bacterium]|jgi:hypothetical protein
MTASSLAAWFVDAASLADTEKARVRRRRAFWLWWIAAAAFMLFPFQFEYLGPLRVPNGASTIQGGGVAFTGPSVMRTDSAPDWVADAIQAGELDLTLRLETARTNQRGPARIVTLSDGSLRRNFMVSQKGPDLLVRARREGADENGAPPLKVDGVFDPPREVTLEVHFHDQGIDLTIDGVPRYAEKLASNSLELWDPTFRLGLGDEVNGARGWSGELRAAVATVQGEAHDLLHDPALEHPTSFWHVPEQTRLLWRFDSSYAILFESLHVLLFAPFGALLWLRKRRPGLGPVLRIVLLGLAVGTAFQIIKIGFPGRHPSLYHAPFNALGTLLGAYLAARLTRASARTTP